MKLLLFNKDISSIKVQNLQYKFWIENDPLPFELFQKFLRFGTLTRPVLELKLAFKKYKSVWVTNSRKLGKC